MSALWPRLPASTRPRPRRPQGASRREAGTQPRRDPMASAGPGSCRDGPGGFAGTRSSLESPPQSSSVTAPHLDVPAADVQASHLLVPLCRGLVSTA